MSLTPYGIEGMISAIGRADLGDAVLTAAGALQVDEIFAFASRPRQAPQPLAASGRQGAFGDRVRLYANRFYRHDPLLLAIAASPSDGSQFSFRVHADEIGDAEYRRECFEKPRLSEKFSFACQQGGDWLILNLYRRRRSRAASDEALAAFAQIAVPVMAKHAEIVGRAAEPLLTKIERGLARHYPGLTRRERQVCARTLIGMTAAGTGIDLGVSTATVLTYRRRAYERLEISSANQLIGCLLA